MKTLTRIFTGLVVVAFAGAMPGQEVGKSSFSPVVPREPLATTLSRMSGEKPAVMKRQKDLLEQRYDLRNEPAPNLTMTRGKAVQAGVRVRLPAGWPSSGYCERTEWL